MGLLIQFTAARSRTATTMTSFPRIFRRRKTCWLTPSKGLRRALLQQKVRLTQKVLTETQKKRLIQEAADRSAVRSCTCAHSRNGCYE